MANHIWIEIDHGVGILYITVVLIYMLRLYKERKEHESYPMYSLEWFLYYGEHILIFMYLGVAYLHFRDHYGWWDREKTARHSSAAIV